jgi:hypothetical protein
LDCHTIGACANAVVLPFFLGPERAIFSFFFARAHRGANSRSLFLNSAGEVPFSYRSAWWKKILERGREAAAHHTGFLFFKYPTEVAREGVSHAGVDQRAWETAIAPDRICAVGMGMVARWD